MRKRSLGRGLSDLLATDSHPRSRTVVDVPLDDIRPNPHQPRAEMDEGALEELAQSIEAHGVLQPVIVRRRGDSYELVAGERRCRASRLAGLDMVPCLIQDIDDPTSLQIALIENLQRDNLNEVELAAGYRSLIDDFGLTQEELAQRIGKSRSTVTNTLRLLDLPYEVQQSIRGGKLSAGHGRALLSLGAGAPELLTFAASIIENGLSVRATEDLVREYNTTPQAIAKTTEFSAEPATHPNPYIAAAEDRLQSLFAAKVSIKARKKRGGTIIIHYFDDEDLSRIVDEMGAGPSFP